MRSASDWCAEKFAHRFTDETLLQRALTHRSVSSDNNERLEFLGDALLGAVISRLVFDAAPDLPEGRLSRLRSALVRESTLADVARELDIGEYVELGPGERKTGGHRRDSILADTFEAIIGAIYLDVGFNAVFSVVAQLFDVRLQEIPTQHSLKDPKSQLQEYLQGRSKDLPEYLLLGTEGKPHEQVFEIRCVVTDPDVSAVATGSSRRNAEQSAARKVLHTLGVA